MNLPMLEGTIMADTNKKTPKRLSIGASQHIQDLLDGSKKGISKGAIVETAIDMLLKDTTLSELFFDKKALEAYKKAKLESSEPKESKQKVSEKVPASTEGTKKEKKKSDDTPEDTNNDEKQKTSNNDGVLKW